MTEPRVGRATAARPGLLRGAAALAALPLLLFLAWRVLIRRRPTVPCWSRLRGDAPPIAPGALWLHGVSLGEVALMAPILDGLAAHGERCLLSTSTVTGWQGLQRHASQHVPALLPFDLPWAVDRFLSRTRPRALLLLELEIWPNLLAACRARGIPVILVNARLSARSHRGYRRWRRLLRPAFAAIDGVLAQNALWAARCRALGLRRVAVTGSLKADVVRPVDATARDAEAVRLGLPVGDADAKRILLGASTGSGEEEAILAAWEAEARGAGWRLVVCPRHPERGAALAALCQSRGHTAQRSSCDPLPAPAGAVLIVDEIGRLGALYANAAIAIVGGSLGSGRGGQNMLEAAAAGCAVVVGPDTRNQPDGMALLRAHRAVREGRPATLAATLAPLLADPALRAGLGHRAQTAWRSGRGAQRRIVQQLQAWGIVGRPTLSG